MMSDTANAFAGFLTEREPRWNGTIFVDRTLESFENSDDAAVLKTLNAVAREKGWREGVKAAHGASMLDYVDNADRLIFLPLLPLEPHHHILEIGPGLGQISIPIARMVQSVDALEVVAAQAEFCTERARQEGVSNVRFTAGGDQCLLPYEDRSFDGVVLNLVLEWCGSRLPHMSHHAAHQRLLAEIARVLKPGGFVYLVTKNRYGLRCLTGGRDEHIRGMRFGSALPRWLAEIVAGKSRQAGYLHSYNELRGMIGDAGFHCIKSYWAAPEMRWPSKVLALDETLGSERAKGGFAEGENQRTSWIMRMLPDRMIKHFTPGLTFLARKIS